MRSIRRLALLIGALGIAIAPGTALADAVAHSTVGAGGYDLVSYHTGEKPVRGNGNHVVVHEGVTYLFQSEESRERFADDPGRFLPAYGGYCAYGVAVGKKFVGDPDVWEIVDGRLYLNLDNEIQGVWSRDVPGNIAKAERNWPRIEGVPAAKL